MNLKIGILIREFGDLSNWQLRIIQAILNEPTLELTLVIQEAKNQKGINRNSFSRAFSKISLSQIVLSLQISIEKKVFFKEVYSVDKESLIHNLQLLPIIKLGQRNMTRPDVLGPKTMELIQEQDLDLLINLGFYHVPLDLIKLAKNGIWDFLYADFSSVQQGPVGFSEVLHKKPSIGFTLLKRTADMQVEIVDHAFFNRAWSMVETARTAREGSVSVLLKNLKQLQKGHRLDVNSLVVPKSKRLGLYQTLKYITQFYMHLSGKIFQKVAQRFWGQRHECWSIFMGKGFFMESSLSNIKPLEMPKDEFWADPFLFKYGETDYVFFENYSYKSKRGKISCGKVRNQELIELIDVLDFDYHLSFPFIFEEDGEIFLMPETCENKRLEIYRAVDFPSKWELFTTAFEGEMLADAFFFDDAQNQKWLFVNKQAAETSPMNSELYIYKMGSIRLENLQPHAQNPVIIDARVARNAGSIFEYKNEFYRPSQRNTDGVYGRALNINRIEKLTIDEYKEENIRICEPDFDKNLVAMHHLHQNNDLYVFDAAYGTK